MVSVSRLRDAKMFSVDATPDNTNAVFLTRHNTYLFSVQHAALNVSTVHIGHCAGELTESVCLTKGALVPSFKVASR